MAMLNKHIALIATTSIMLAASTSAQAADKYKVSGVNNILTGWNVIVLGKDRSAIKDRYSDGKIAANTGNTGVYNLGSQRVDGRVFAGGNMTAGTGTVNLNGSKMSTDSKSTLHNVPGLTVVGSVNGTVRVGNHGGASIGGSTTTTYLTNGTDGKVQVGGASSILQSTQRKSDYSSGINSARSTFYDAGYLASLNAEKTTIGATLIGASAGFALSGNTAGDTWSRSKTTLNFNVTGKGVTAGGNQLHFINIGASDLLSASNINFFSNVKQTAHNFDGTLVVNVSGNLQNMTLADCFNQSGFGKNVLFNFYQQTGTITVNGNFQASILAPHASGVVGSTGSIEGLAVFNTLTQKGDIRFADCTNVGFRGAVPETSTWGMMLIGFGAVGGALRRRRRTILAAA